MEAVLVAVGLFFCALAAIAIAVAGDLAKVGVSLLTLRDAAAKRAEERDERETSALATMRRQLDEAVSDVAHMKTEQKVWMNANRR